METVTEALNTKPLVDHASTGQTVSDPQLMTRVDRMQHIYYTFTVPAAVHTTHATVYFQAICLKN